MQQKRQTVTISVADAAGPIIGANVLIKGTINGGITDTDGVATLHNVPVDATLVVSYIGYATQEVAVDARRSVHIVLVEDTQFLKDVVVVGYGSLEKK